MRPARLGESKNRDERLQGGWREKERKKEREEGWDKRGEKEVRSTGTLAFVFAGSGCPTAKERKESTTKASKNFELKLAGVDGFGNELLASSLRISSKSSAVSSIWLV